MPWKELISTNPRCCGVGLSTRIWCWNKVGCQNNISSKDSCANRSSDSPPQAAPKSYSLSYCPPRYAIWFIGGMEQNVVVGCCSGRGSPWGVWERPLEGE